MILGALKERSDGVKGTNIHNCVTQKHTELFSESLYFVSAVGLKNISGMHTKHNRNLRNYV